MPAIHLSQSVSQSPAQPSRSTRSQETAPPIHPSILCPLNPPSSIHQSCIYSSCTTSQSPSPDPTTVHPSINLLTPSIYPSISIPVSIPVSIHHPPIHPSQPQHQHHPPNRLHLTAPAPLPIQQPALQPTLTTHPDTTHYLRTATRGRSSRSRGPVNARPARSIEPSGVRRMALQTPDHGTRDGGRPRDWRVK